MSRSFEFKLKSDPDQVITKARTVARENGVQFVGDGQTGRFAGHGIEGSYLILEDILSIKISRKPLIMPWAMIETTLRKFFS